jgi:aryl carrier-like protein
MIKLRGFRIEPREIEAALCRHPAVSQAAALLRPDPAGEPRLVAYFVAPATPGDLRPFLHSRLPYYMVPALLHRLDALPFNASGKLDRKRLPNPDWETQIPEEFVAPRTPAEHTLAGVWSEVLNLTRVGVTQDFFAIGGDSIRSIQVIARARAAGLHLQPADLFRHRTIAALAAHLGQAAPAPSAPAPLPELAVSPEHLALALRQIDFDQEEA